MSNRTPRYNGQHGFDTRLSRLETIIDSISGTLDKIQNKLENGTKINWAPVGLGISIFITVVGAFITIYTTHMANTDSNVKALTEQTQALAVASTEQRISVQTLKDRQDDMKTQMEKRFDDVDGKFSRIYQRIRDDETGNKHKPDSGF